VLQAAARRDTLRVAFVALASAVICWLSYRFTTGSISDFDQLVIAARALIRGENPYRAVVAWGHPYPLWYPLPAVLVAVPVAWLPLELARAAWAGIGGGCLAAAALRYRRALPVALLSASFGNALALGQWSPIATSAAVFPLLAAVWIAKPTIGSALFAAFPSRRAGLSATGILLLSFAVWPGWVGSWIDALGSAVQVSPVLRPGGVILLLAALRWRLPEGRLMLALAVVPQTTGMYETLPLFLIPHTRREGYILAVLGYVGAFGQAIFVPYMPGMSLEELLHARWLWVLTFFYVPALIMLLRRRRARTTDPATSTSSVTSPATNSASNRPS
jgi:hypothetical protein